MITSGKRDSKEKTVSKEKGKKMGRKSKLLTPIPGQDVDIPLVVGGALVVWDTTFSPLTGGLNANESSLQDTPLSQILIMMQPLEKTLSLEKQMMK